MDKGRSIPILRMTRRGVSIDTDSLNSVFEQVGNRPFACYSINGPKRTGKSFVLNKCLSFLNAKQKKRLRKWFEKSTTEEKYFEWRGGSERSTIGINIWSKPFFTHLEGREIAILLMDTQGSFDDQTTTTQNSIVFALSSLMSSVLIYNIQRDIGEDTLAFLHLFSGYAKMATDEDECEEDAFQKLIFLIRDFQFRDFKCGYYDERTCPPGQLENFRHKLNPQQSQPNQVRNVRQQILKDFQHIGIFALPHPGNKLSLEDEETDLDQCFAKHAKDFVELIFSNENIELKRIGSTEVTGYHFMKFIAGWAKLFQGNELPEISSIAETAAKMQSQIFIQKSLSSYDREMKKFFKLNPEGISDKKFEKQHLSLKEEIVAAFRKMKKLGGKSYEPQFLDELDEGLEVTKRVFKNMNMTYRQAAEQQNELRSQLKGTEKALKKAEEREKREREKMAQKIEHQDRQISRMDDEIKTMKKDKENDRKQPERRPPRSYPPTGPIGGPTWPWDRFPLGTPPIVRIPGNHTLG